MPSILFGIDTRPYKSKNSSACCFRFAPLPRASFSTCDSGFGLPRPASTSANCTPQAISASTNTEGGLLESCRMLRLA
jgi:hypothetical protein